jgi:hypothetical protein
MSYERARQWVRVLFKIMSRDLKVMGFPPTMATNFSALATPLTPALDNPVLE